MYYDLEESHVLTFDEEMVKDDFTFNRVRVKQVFAAIMENGLDPFDDYGLAKLLSMLTMKEFEILKTNLVEQFGFEAQYKLDKIEPLYRFFVEKEIREIRKKDLYKFYIEALHNGKYVEFFKSLSVEELADLKKIVVFNVDFKDSINRSASKKLFDFITHEIRTRNIKKIAEV